MGSLLRVFFIALLPQVIADGVTDAITLSCHSSHMFVDVDLKYFTSSIDPNSLHLQDHHCRPHHYDKTKASFRVPLHGCGTASRVIHDKLLIFSNAVRNSDDNTTNEISRVPSIRLPFGCGYKSRYSFVVRGGGPEKSPVLRKKNPLPKQKTALNQQTLERSFMMSSKYTHHVSRFVQILTMVAVLACI